MKFKNKRKGNNLVEYSLIVVSVGMALGVGLLQIDKNLFKSVFTGSITSSTKESADKIITIAPLSE